MARNIFSKPLVFGDTPWVNANSPEIIGQYILNMWNPAAYGENNPKPQSYLILYAFAKISSALGDATIYNFLMHLSIPLGYLAFYQYSKKFCDKTLTRLFGATFYIINPVTIAYFAAGQLMWILAFLPLSMNYFTDMLEKQKIEDALKAALFTSLTLWTLPPITFALILGLTTMTLSYALFERNSKIYLQKLGSKIFVFAAVLTLLMAPHIYSTIVYTQSPDFNVGGNPILDFQYTYQEATIPNLLRLAGNGGSPQIQLGYNETGNIKNEWGYIIPLMAFTSIFWIKNQNKKQRVTASLVLLGFALLLAVSLRYICNSEINWIISDNVILWTLRNPFKIQLLILTATAPLFAYSLEKTATITMKCIKQRNLKLAAITATLTFLAISHIYFYNTFIFNGYMGIDQHPGMEIASIDKTISSIVNDSLTWADSSGYRGIILPFDHRTELYVEFSNMLLYPARLGKNSKIAEILGNAISGNVNLENYMRLLSVKYAYINEKWQDTGFYIIQPQNPQIILSNLNNTAEPDDKGSGYFKVTIENALPTLYVSQYPIFYSNIETINLLDKSYFLNHPVFLEMENKGQNITMYNGKTLKIFNYSLNVPFAESYNIYAAAYVNGEKATAYYQLDNEEMNEEPVAEGQSSIIKIGQNELQSGEHNLSFAVDDIDWFTEMNHSFINYGNGTYQINGQTVKIMNGSLIGLNEYENFDLSLNFKALNYGNESWHGPYVYFSFTDDSYYYAVFHKNGLLELAKYSNGQHQSFMALKQTNMNFEEWNNLRIIKVGDTVSLYMNNQQITSLKDPILGKKGKIGIGSLRSSTLYQNITITPNVLQGLWLIPKENKTINQPKILKTAPGHYTLKLNETNKTEILLFLGENYDPQWETTINGEKAPVHFKANTYGNCWLIKTPQTEATIEIRYKPNTIYQYLLYISLASLILTTITAYLPTSIQNKILFAINKLRQLKKTRRDNNG